MGSFTDRILALAAVFQAARLAQQLAREGRADATALNTSAQSLLLIDAPDTAAIYGGGAGVVLGLELLRDKLAGKTDPGDIEIAKYVISLIHLQGQLRQHAEMQDAIRRGIEAIQTQMKFFDADDNGDAVSPRLIEKLAELYTQTISTLSPRIIVNGEQGHLANALIAAKVRVALFAGIRAAFLWRQLGGGRWQLLFNRRKIAEAAANILQQLSKK
ncbi:MAG: high frequency lysogenization protein HflD [Gammaproteobacteria bacterium]|nr:high frequency lysogenization protein HflD [Gammaproteobacteria bacterium]